MLKTSIFFVGLIFFISMGAEADVVKRHRFNCGGFEVWERAKKPNYQTHSFFVVNPKTKKKVEFKLDPEEPMYHCPEMPHYCKTMADVLAGDHYVLLAQHIGKRGLSMYLFRKKLPLGEVFAWATYQNRPDGAVPGIKARGVCASARKKNR